MEDKKDIKKCNTHVIMRWLGFSGHKWKYNSTINKECEKCGTMYKLIDYDGFCEIWQKV